MNEDLKKLRLTSKAGIMDCKKALEKFPKFEDALKYLYEKGIAKASKRAENETNEGAVVISSNEKSSVIMLWKTETDFVAQNFDFCFFINECAKLFLESDDYIKSKEFDIKNKDITGKIGEKIVLKEFFKMDLEDEFKITSYFHQKTNSNFENIAKVGVLLKCKNADSSLANSLAAHIAAYKPLSLKKEVEVEKENVLYNQKFLFDPSLTIENVLEKNNIEIVDYKILSA